MMGEWNHLSLPEHTFPFMDFSIPLEGDRMERPNMLYESNYVCERTVFKCFVCVELYRYGKFLKYS